MSRAWAIGLGVGFIVALILLGSLATFYTDWLWYRETGFSEVFWKPFWTKIAMGAAFGAIFTAILLINLWIAQKITSPARVFSMRDQVIERYRLILRPHMRKLILGGSVLLGIFAGSGASGQWRNWLLFKHSQSFGELDPVFGKDLGFFVFRLPFHRFLFTWGFSTLLLITVIVAATHYLLGGIRPEGPSPRVAPQVKAHLSVLFGIVVLLKAWAYRLDQFGLLYSDRGTVTGASYTDVNAQLPALRLLVVIAIICAVLFFVNIRFRGWILPAAGLGLLLLVSIVAGGIYPSTVQRLRVNPQERDREKLFIERNIAATREAFGLDDGHVTTRSLPAGATLTEEMVEQNTETVGNLRLWDPSFLIKAYTQLERITNYYEFLDVDVDRYEIDGTKRQVMLSAREMHPSGLPGEARTWVNNHLIYTHGFGMVASRVDQATSEGQPEFVIQDIPPRSVEGAPAITEPRIYYGESEDQPFVVVRSKNEELDFPVGETSFESSSYAGEGGIQMKGILRRSAFAWRFRDVNLLISGAITSDSRIMFYRQVRERVRRAAPFLQLDGDPYLVIDDGRFVWMQDAYTTTENYPYSQRISLNALTPPGHLTGQANYIRNSVKATVDALHGTVTLYVWDEEDPLIKAWQSIFPRQFTLASEMSDDLRAHVRYPEDLFRVQADRFALYHLTDPIDFYSKNDVWRIPQDPTAGDGSLLPPYYVLMKLPDETAPEFILMVPYSPFSAAEGGTRRQNMVSWLAARMDGDNYGQLLSFQYSKDRLVFGPEQIATRIANDQTVREVIASIDPREQRTKWGNLLVVPIGEAVLYVRPLYLESTEALLPEFKRVVVVAGDRIRIAGTIEGAIAALFGRTAPEQEEEDEGADVAELIALALQHFQSGQQALAEGDFARYGREQEAMKRALDRAAEAAGAPVPEPSPSPSPSPSPTGG